MLNHNASDNFLFLVQLRKPILITLNLRIADKGVLWLFFFSIKIDVAFLRNQLLSFCFSIKDKTEFPHKHDQVYTVLNVLKKVVTMTMSLKRQDASRKGWRITVKEIKIMIFQNTNSKRNTHVHNTRILQLLVVVYVITLTEENYQERCGLTLSDHPQTNTRIIFL